MRDALFAEVAAFIDRCAAHAEADGHASALHAERDALLAKLLRFQREHLSAYGKLVAHHERTSASRSTISGNAFAASATNAAGEPASAYDPALDWPALPTDVFRFARVAAHAPEHDARVFRTSGTTQAQRGEHPLRDLALYDRAARAAARHLLFPDRERMRLVVLAPRSEELPDSSLSYMLDRFGTWFGDGPSVYVWRDGALDLPLLRRTLQQAEAQHEAVALLGTSFAFVHAEDGLGADRFALPAGSRIMQTGGFKGRSREVAPAEMLQRLGARYGVAEPFIVAEYGMTELSSQLYESTLRDAVLGRPIGPRRLLAPAWVRVTLVDTETLAPAAPGEEGLVRLDDLANVDTACAIQTSDRGLPIADGLTVLGRAAGATPRGCSLAVDAALASASHQQDAALASDKEP